MLSLLFYLKDSSSAKTKMYQVPRKPVRFVQQTESYAQFEV